MSVIHRHPSNSSYIRFTVNVKPETKKKLEDYAYKKRMTLALTIDTILNAGIDKDILNNDTSSRKGG